MDNVVEIEEYDDGDLRIYMIASKTRSHDEILYSYSHHDRQIRVYCDLAGYYTIPDHLITQRKESILIRRAQRALEDHGYILEDHERTQTFFGKNRRNSMIVDRYLAARAAYDAAKADLAAAEAAIVAELAESVPAEGAKTVTHCLHKITLTARVNRRLDLAEWETVLTELTAEGLGWVGEIVDLKPTLNASKCKLLAQKEPKIWAACARAITETPGKVTVSVKEVAQ